jgi:MFS family permease
MSAAGLVRAPFPRYWLSAFLADFGDGVRLAAFPLLAAQMTRSPAAVATVTAVQGLPWLVIGLGAGAIVDRRDLRKTMVCVDVVRAMMIATLAVGVAAHVMSLPLIYLTAFTTGVGSMVRDTAATTAVPRLIDHDELERANGHLVAGGIVGTELAGPAVGGWLFGVAAALPFALNAGSLGIAILLLLTLPSVFGPLRRPQGSAGVLRAATGDIREGLAWLRRDRPVRDLVVAAGIVSAADGAYLAVFVLYVTQVLQRSAAVYGLLLAVGAVGGIAAGAFCARLTRRIGARRMLRATVIMMAATQLVLALTSNVLVAAGTLACSSGAFAAYNATSRSMRQRRAPAHLLGRVNSTYLTVGRSAGAAGALTGGVLAAAAGIQAAILAGVAPLLGAAILIARGDRPQRPPADPARP